MKKWICALLTLLLLSVYGAMGEESETLEIISVDIAPVATQTPKPTATPEISATPVATSGNTASPTPEGSGTDVADAAPSAASTVMAPPSGPVTLAFEDGFTLELPEGWRYHEVSDEMAEQGVYYNLSDSTGNYHLYIQSWLTDCQNMDGLKELIDRTVSPQSSGIYAFNDTDFVVYDLSAGDVSCCAALKNGHILNFVFTPQSDPDFMLTAAQIMSSYTDLDF